MGENNVESMPEKDWRPRELMLLVLLEFKGQYTAPNGNAENGALTVTDSAEF